MVVTVIGVFVVTQLKIATYLNNYSCNISQKYTFFFYYIYNVVDKVAVAIN